MILKYWLLLVFICIFHKCKSNNVKSSLTFVIDETQSMTDDIEEVKRRAKNIVDAVSKSKESQIDNFVLVTFHDPVSTLKTVTSESHVFKAEVAKLKINMAKGNNDCPEYCMTGIELALKNSLPGSYIYVFTDASAKDYNIHDRVKSLAQSKSCQVSFLLTGMCGALTDPQYVVFNTLAKATNGQVFHLGKADVGDIINYVVESVKGRRNVIRNAELKPGYGHKIKFSVDSGIDNVIISVSGTKPKVSVTDDKGTPLKVENLVDKDNIKIVKIVDPAPGEYTAEVGSATHTSIVLSAKTTLNFLHGFSTFKPSSLLDTATRPIADRKSYLMIQLYDDKKKDIPVKLVSAKIINMDGTVEKELPLEIVDEKQYLYVAQPFESPKRLFNIMVTGIDTKTGKTLTRTTLTPIEPQNPAIEKKENKAPTISIEGEPKVIVEYDESFMLKCIVNAYPKPDITWKDKSTGKALATTVSDVELPYKYIGTFDMEKANKNGTYECTATNAHGTITKSIEIETKRKIYINPVQVPKDITIKQHASKLIFCKVDAYPPATITWYKNEEKLHTVDDLVVSDDGTKLIFLKIQPNKEGLYKCVADNGYKKEVYKFTVTVSEVKENKAPTISIEGEPKIIVEYNESFMLKCMVNAYPKPDITWKDKSTGEALATRVSDVKLPYEYMGTFNIEKVNRNGIYECTATNAFGTITKTIDIQTKYFKPIQVPKDITLKYKDKGIITCEIDANPPAIITWYKNEELLHSAGTLVISDDGTQLIFLNVQPSEKGLYKCVAQNGYKKEEYKFTVTVSGVDCVIDIKKDLTGNMPIVLDPTLKWPKFEAKDGYIRIQHDYLRLGCRTKFINFPDNQITAYCEGETNFRVNGKIYKFNDLQCAEKIQPEFIETKEPCFDGETEWITVGFKMFDKFFSVYAVCLDRKNNVPIYAKHNLDKYLATVETEISEWMHGLLPFNFEELYDCNSQLTGISNDLDRFFHAKDECCFTRRQLVNPRDVPPGLGQLATYHYLNVVPHWSTCGTKNWEEVENKLRNLVKTIDYSLEVVTGISKPLEILNKRSGMKELMIRDSTNNGQPVSRYLWKVVQDRVKKISVVIIQINIPDLTPTEVSKHVLCKDICNDIEWMKNPDWRDVNKGYTYCCSLAEFTKAFDVKGIFD